MFEDILRAAKKANGENLNKPPAYPMVKTPKYDAPTSRHEKKWVMCLLLIIVPPLLLFGQGGKMPVGVQVPNQPATKQRGYSVGHLKRGSAWQDRNGQSHYNEKDTKVEIWEGELVTSEGAKLTQIYFLEGSNAGSWGYARASFLSF